ncbi:hypothetical protein IW261DRAFT_1520518 [Armillaria novae-zelandiae]|uniref:Uncharacterized protein n=1 Tax=Armillaria novae-zelandiae TaxID=153914 RepID=A0AA39NJ85_9AGAR|nr:hypothetical protein IW261DRAFT_1520518 [Armillaria novae-zelandiae]
MPAPIYHVRGWYNAPCPPPSMNAPTSSFKTVKKSSGNSKDAITASAEVAKVIVAVGEMVPLVGGFVKGLGGVALVLLTNLEQFCKNKEDVEELAKDIIDILTIARDAGINVSIAPDGHENTTDFEDLRKACLKFQEFLSDLTIKVVEMNRSEKGPWQGIKQFITSRNIQEEITGHRQSMEAAKSKLLLSLSLNSNASISHVKHGISSLQYSQMDLFTVASDIQRDVSHIRANYPGTVINNKFHNLRYADIQLREVCPQDDLYGSIDNPTRRTSVIKFTADVATLSRVMVVKEYSGDLGLMAWKSQLEIHGLAGRHPNLRQLYGVVQSGLTPSLVFYWNAGEMALKDFPKLFDKHLEFLAHTVLTHAFHNAFRFSLTRLQVTFGFDDVRCTPDGRLLFDDLQFSPSWDKLYIKNLADLFRPASPDIQDVLDSFMKRHQEPVIAKEHLLLYYDIISVVASLHGNVFIPLERNTMFGKIFINDIRSDRCFLVDCIEDEPLPVRISIIPEPEPETLLQLSSSLWRYTLPEDIVTMELTCIVSLTTEAKRECFFRWFTQGARILGQICKVSNGSRTQLFVSQITQRYFKIRIEADWNREPSSVPYLFIDMTIPNEDQISYVPNVYLSSDPHGAGLGVAHASDIHYLCSVTDAGHDVVVYPPIGLECSTLLHKICGFHPLSPEIARHLKQPELAMYLIQDEGVNIEISRNMIGCSPIPEAAMIVPWQQIKPYSDMLDDLEIDPSQSQSLDHDMLREPQIYEVNTDGKMDHIVVQACVSGLTSDSSPQGVAPMFRVSLAVYILGSIGTILFDSPLIRVLLVLGLFVYSWVRYSAGF